MSKSGYQARRSAVHLLDQVMDKGRLLSEVIGGGALQKLAPEDRARAQRLATETLRNLERADRILQKHLKKTPAITVQNVLRTATVELCQGGAADSSGGMKGSSLRRLLLSSSYRKSHRKRPSPYTKVPKSMSWLTNEPLA